MHGFLAATQHRACSRSGLLEIGAARVIPEPHSPEPSNPIPRIQKPRADPLGVPLVGSETASNGSSLGLYEYRVEQDPVRHRSIGRPRGKSSSGGPI